MSGCVSSQPANWSSATPSPPHTLHVAGRSPSRRIPDGQELQPPVEPISFGRSGIVGELGATRPTIDRSLSQLPAVPSTLLAPTAGGVAGET